MPYLFQCLGFLQTILSIRSHLKPPPSLLSQSTPTPALPTPSTARLASPAAFPRRCTRMERATMVALCKSNRRYRCFVRPRATAGKALLRRRRCQVRLSTFWIQCFIISFEFQHFINLKCWNVSSKWLNSHDQNVEHMDWTGHQALMGFMDGSLNHITIDDG